MYEIIKPIDKPLYLSYYYRRKGLYFYRKEEYVKAIKFHQESVKISKNLKNKWSIASDYSNIGDVYYKMKEYDEALSLFKKSFLYYEEEKGKYKFFHGFSKYQLAKTYFAQEEIHLALNFSLKANPLMESMDQNGNPEISKLNFRGPYILRNHLLLVRIYILLNILDKVELHLKKSKYYIEKLKLSNFRSEYFLLQSKYHQKKNNKIFNLNIAKEFLKESKDKGKLSLCVEYFELFKSYAELNNKPLKKAMYADSITHYTRKIFFIDKAKAISQYQAKFETQKAEFETQKALNKNSLLTIENLKKERKAKIYLSAIIIISLILTLVLYIWRTRQKENKSKLKIKDLKISSLLHKNELENLNGLMAGQEKERNRIAQDLHDSVGGMLSSVKMHFNKIMANANFSNKNEEKLFTQANYLLDESCTEVRRVAHDLHTVMQKNGGLEGQIINLKNAIELSNNIEIDIFYDVNHDVLNSEIENELYKITLELMGNSLKHAKASQINLQIIGHEIEIDYIFEDNGIGFKIDHIKRGLGLTSIENRVRKLGGVLQIDSHEKSGSTFIINISQDKI